MRQKLRLFPPLVLAITAGLLLASCAGFAPARRESVSKTAGVVELIDWRLQASPVEPGTVAVLRLDVPDVPSVAISQSSQSPSSQGVQSGPSDVSMASAAAPKPDKRDQVDISVAIRLPEPPKSEAFGSGPGPVIVSVAARVPLSGADGLLVLAVPEPPAPKPVAATAKPSVATPQKATTSVAPAAATQTAATQTAAKASTVQPLAPAAPLNLREVYARPGDEVQVGLENAGYLYLGPGATSSADGMVYKSKETRDGKTYFTFKAEKPGVFDLSFMLQDNTTGTTKSETVRVTVTATGQPAAASAQPVSKSTVVTSFDSADYEYAEKLVSMGKIDAAISVYLQGYTEGDSYTADRIASLYLRGGDTDAAEKYFKQNLAASNPFRENAVLGMVRIAVARGDPKGLLNYLNSFLAITSLDVEETMIRAARMESSKNETGVGLELCSQYVRKYPQGKWVDEAAFLMAQLLERDTQFRDIARSRDIYRLVLEVYPESLFAGQARDRLQYIERHFFLVH